MSKRILILGGGYVGMYTAWQLQKKLKWGEASVTVVDPRSSMTYQPFLPEIAAGAIEPRHAVVSLRKLLKDCTVITGRVERIDHARRCVEINPPEGPGFEFEYDILVVALGSISRTMPIPGLAENGMGFKQIEEATALRNQVLERLDIAGSSLDPSERKKALAFVFVGGGYAGVEALAEAEDLARYATRYFETLSESDVRFVLVEATNRILPEVGEDMGKYTVKELERRGIEVRLGTRLESAVDQHIVLSDGEEFDADTLVWTAGVKANPVVNDSDLPLDDRGRVKTRPTLQIDGLDDAWAAGDCAGIPDLTNPGQFLTPSAQHAVRAARVLADNLVASVRGGEIEEYRHKYVGSVASLGLYKGVAQVYGIKLRGFPAWFMHRSYHVSRMPTLAKKVSVVVDWTIALFFKRQVESLGALQRARDDFSRANQPPA
jgi:NADH:ubiquinone reductase (H+-translocating)